MNSANPLHTSFPIPFPGHGGKVVPLRVAESRVRGHALEAVLDDMAIPMLLVTACSKILFMNAAAERLILASDGLTASADELRALLPAETRLLRALISATARTCAARGRTPREMLRVSRPYGRQRLEVLISPLSIESGERPQGQLPSAVLFVTDPQSRPEIEEVALIKLYGLTRCEAKVAAAVCRGLSGKEICRELHISYNTVKTHLKHVYAKTCTRHQSDLVRLLASGLALNRSGG